MIFKTKAKNFHQSLTPKVEVHLYKIMMKDYR